MLDSSLNSLSDLSKSKSSKINDKSSNINQQDKQEKEQLNNNNNQKSHQLNMSSSNSSLSCEEYHTYQLNEKVTNLASNIYQELEKIVKCYGRDTVKDLMPIVVNILEALDGAYQEKEEQIVENELLKDDNQQLLNQYEREKQSRKDCEQKTFILEDLLVEQRKDNEEKLQSLESIVRMMELKSKNASDHVTRLEEKENEMKREYTKLHERYTELFKTHCDYMERTKILFGTDRLDQLQNLNSNNSNNTYQRKRTLTTDSSISFSKQQTQRLIDLLTINKNNNSNLNKNDILNAINSSSRQEITNAITNLLQEIEQQQQNEAQVEQSNKEQQLEEEEKDDDENNLNENDLSCHNKNNKLTTSTPYSNDRACYIDNNNDKNQSSNNKNGCFNSSSLQVSDNFDDAFENGSSSTGDDNNSTNNMNMMLREVDYEIDDDTNSIKNDLSLFNELSRENYDPTELDDGADLTGMTREVANLIRENQELLQTKHALNVLKDDLIVKLDSYSSEMVILREEIKSLQTVKACLQLRITELEEDLKKTREELDERITRQEEDDENVPMSQRKRFTRAEMARVLMERNQFKEKLIDLQETVRYTEMIRASKLDPSLVSQQQQQQQQLENTPQQQQQLSTRQQSEKKRSNLWKLRTINRLNQQQNTSSSSINIRRQNENKNINESGTLSFLYSMMPKEILGVPVNEIKRDLKDSTSQLSSFFSDLFGGGGGGANTSTLTSSNKQSNESQQRSIIQTQSSSSSISSSPKLQVQSRELTCIEQVVPSDSNSHVTSNEKLTKVYEFLKEDEKLNKKLTTIKGHVCKEEGRIQAYGWSLPSTNANLTSSSSSSSSSLKQHTVPVPVYCRPLFERDTNYKLSCASAVNLDYSSNIKDSDTIIKSSLYYNSQTQTKDGLTSYVWLCNLNTNTDTQISIIDGNRPGEIKQEFYLKSIRVLCIHSVPGAKPDEYPLSKEQLDLYESKKFIKSEANDDLNGFDNITYIEMPSNETLNNSAHIENSSESLRKDIKSVDDIESDLISQSSFQIIDNTELTLSTKLTFKDINDDDNDKDQLILSSLYPTMFLGTQEGWLLIHSSVKNVSKTVDKVKLKDSILSIIYNSGRILAALSDGTLAMFHRDQDGLWDLKNYNLFDFGRPHHSIRCLVNVNSNETWCGCRNKIYVLNLNEFKIQSIIEAHPRKESQVRHMACIGMGIWVSIRLDSTIRLFHAKTHQHLQYLDVEPFVTRMLGSSNLGLSLIRITTLSIINKRLWLGTGNGVIISIPLNIMNNNNNKTAVSLPGSAIRLQQQQQQEQTTNNNSDDYLPYCNLNEAQFSFHGHRDAVKFFINVPGQIMNKLNTTNEASLVNNTNKDISLILSGGQGYIDFRIGDIKSQERLNNNNEEVISSASNNQLTSLLNKIERSHLIVWQLINSDNS